MHCIFSSDSNREMYSLHWGLCETCRLYKACRLLYNSPKRFNDTLASAELLSKAKFHTMFVAGPTVFQSHLNARVFPVTVVTVGGITYLEERKEWWGEEKEAGKLWGTTVMEGTEMRGAGEVIFPRCYHQMMLQSKPSEAPKATSVGARVLTSWVIPFLR